ncbi:hypothetical protein SteCoe_2653 [Stentor coeruleus]|uniref:Penicillin amidase n=1 Tax=Stentor coeruleus TaxID=5963 RepID=A0A1R2CYU3_9CILI|nr:hypothetical protein SteCoe_2653 [Stentor coeruleus]
MLKKLCIILILPIVLATVFYAYIQHCPPESIRLTDYVSNPVDIIRDSDSVPHIYAENIYDACYGIGYATGQDRLWQIDAYRRIATGRLSEILGEKALNIDIFMRNVKVPQMARRDIESASPQAIKAFNSFAAGINAAAKSQWLPIEYYLTRSSWEDLSITDIQANIHLMSIGLGKAWGNDILKHQLLDLIGIEIEWLITSDSQYLNPNVFIISENELPEELRSENIQLQKIKLQENLDVNIENDDTPAGSNAWAVSGKHTKSGKPIVANDPHLSLTIPSMWYMHHIYLPNNTFSGMLPIGSPFMSIGRSNDFAWTSTSMKTDDVDVYIEKIFGDEYLYGDKYFKLKQFEEVIKIKGKEPRKYVFKETIHGPLLEYSMMGVKKLHPAVPIFNSTNLSYCFINHYLVDRTMDFILDFMNAKNILDVRESVWKSTATRIAMIIASKSGDLYYQSTSQIPIRRVKGDRPLAGWLINNTWDGFIPSKEMPYSINPEKGFIVNANNFIVPKNYKYHDSLGQYYSTGRAERITEILQEKISKGHKFTSNDMIEMFQDELDYFARDSLPHMLSMLKVPENYTSEVQSMKNWDFKLSRNSHGGAIWAVWIKQIAINLVKDKIPKEKLQSFLKSVIMQLNLPKIFKPNYPSIERICDNKSTEKVENCSDLVSQAFIEACDIVYGRNWQDLHIAQLKHLPFSDVPILKRMFERYKPVGGTYSTIHSMQYNWAEDHFMAHNGPGAKFVADLGDDEETYWSIQSGVSGNVFSRFYDNLLEEFDYGKLEKFTFSKERKV